MRLKRIVALCRLRETERMAADAVKWVERDVLSRWDRARQCAVCSTPNDATGPQLGQRQTVKATGFVYRNLDVNDFTLSLD